MLEEQGGALGGAQHDDGVDVGDVDTFVEQVDGEHDADPSVGEVVECGFSFEAVGVAADGDGGDAVAAVVGHEVVEWRTEQAGQRCRADCSIERSVQAA